MRPVPAGRRGVVRMKKQSSRARAQSTPPVRHQLEHEVPTVIHNPEEDMTALARWAHHAMLEPGRYLAWPLTIVGVLVIVGVALSLSSGRSSTEAEIWKKLEAATTPAERVEIAKKDAKSPAATWTLLQAATTFYNEALVEMPREKDAAATALKKALDLFEQVGRDASHDSPQARIAAMGKARTLEMRNELSRAVEQYRLIAKEWPDSPEAEEARRYADALQDPQAADFYKDLYAYKPTEITLPPEGSVNLPVPGAVGAAATPTPPTAPSEQPSALSPGLDAIPGLREVVEPRSPAPKADKAAAGKDQKKDLPSEVFAPKAGETRPK